MNLYKGKLELNKHGGIATVCGWGHEDAKIYDYIEIEKYSQNLRCITLKLNGHDMCHEALSAGEYSRKIFCGTAEDSKQVTTMVTT